MKYLTKMQRLISNIGNCYLGAVQEKIFECIEETDVIHQVLEEQWWSCVNVK